MTDEEKKAIAIQTYENIKQDNKKILDDLIDEIEQRMRARDLSDKYLEEHGLSTREDVGIGEYAYGITMIPCEWIYPYLLDLQSKNNLIKKQSKEIEELKEKDTANLAYYDQIYQNGIYTGQRAVEDKIKAKIEEYKKQIEKMEKDDIGRGFTLGKEWSDLKAKVEFGQSLLEKE